MWRYEVENPLEVLRHNMPNSQLPSIRMLDLLSKVLAPAEHLEVMVCVKEVIDGRVRNDIPSKLFCASAYYFYLLSETNVERHAIDEIVHYETKTRRKELVVTIKRIGKLLPVVFVIENEAERYLHRFRRDTHNRQVELRGDGHMTLTELNQSIQKVYLACNDLSELDGIKQIVGAEDLFVDAMIVGYQAVVSILHNACELPLKQGITDGPIVSSGGGLIAMTLREGANALNKGQFWCGGWIRAEISMNRTYLDEGIPLEPKFWNAVREASQLEFKDLWNDLVNYLADTLLLTSLCRPNHWKIDELDDKRYVATQEVEEFRNRWVLEKT